MFPFLDLTCSCRTPPKGPSIIGGHHIGHSHHHKHWSSDGILKTTGSSSLNKPSVLVICAVSPRAAAALFRPGQRGSSDTRSAFKQRNMHWCHWAECDAERVCTGRVQKSACAHKSAVSQASMKSVVVLSPACLGRKRNAARLTARPLHCNYPSLAKCKYNTHFCLQFAEQLSTLPCSSPAGALPLPLADW